LAFDFPASPIEGQTFTPPVSGAPEYIYRAPTWQLVSATAPVGMVISDSPPPTPVPGQQWWESDTGLSFVWYDDGNSSQWVQMNGVSGLLEAPIDGKAYVRKDALWVNAGYRIIADINLASAQATADFAIPSDITQMRITGPFEPTAVNVQLWMRFSGDGGATYDAGATAYGTSYISQTQATVSGGAQNAAYMALTAGADNSIHYRTPVNALFSVGVTSSRLTKGLAYAMGWSNVPAVVTNLIFAHSWNSVLTRPTHARFLSSSGNLGAGTRLIVEGV
jgi:hypothetical protein